MLNLKNTKNILQGSFIFLFFILCGPLFADDNGQIININQNYQIAFTDLGNRILKQGDIVKVFINTDDFVYLQVLESSVILSKLGPSKTEGFQTNLNDFQRLAVGDTVTKPSIAQGVGDISAGVVPESDNTQAASSDAQIQKLEQDLANAKKQIKLLQESNEESKATLNELMSEAQVKKEEPVPQEQTDSSKEMLEQLKVHLDNMRKLVNDND